MTATEKINIKLNLIILTASFNTKIGVDSVPADYIKAVDLITGYAAEIFKIIRENAENEGDKL